jgi:molybdopterin-containing oxidoreductase family iron-sulfur binding subunit
VSLSLGHGRTAAGGVGNGTGFRAYALRTAAAPDACAGLKVARTGRSYPLATTQDHHAIDAVGMREREKRSRSLVVSGTLAEYREHPEFAAHRTHHPPLVSLWPERPRVGHAWGMTIDLSTCIGCNACVVACQAENNIPVVGKEQVGKGREMHWLRLDRYFQGDPDAPAVAHQPVACVHCELAPCEQVCPVGATMHSEDGLNVMAYNRCVGTRYCSNNCPYKVRRFNWFNFNSGIPDVRKLAYNPEVTLRARGVMEKCTYCVQRIESVKIDAKNEGRPVRDGEIVTACQQTCPTQAIAFGDLNDPQSRVAKLTTGDRAYHLLAELNVKPRTAYLARLRNPNPELAESADGHPAH